MPVRHNLYIVATPIGNLQDISLRAMSLLLDSNVIIAESASKAGLLLNFIEKESNRKRPINQKIISLTEDEEENKIPQIFQELAENDAVLISEAGTPLISDPGFRLVREAIKKGINIIPVPGPSAPITALSASGLPTDKFIFLGYLPKNKSKAGKLLKSIKDIKTTVIIFESPHRLISTLNLLSAEFGNIDIVISRELTKIHEEIRREKISDSIGHFGSVKPRGEFTLLFGI